MKTKKEVFWNLFISNLYLSAFTFGGGYVIVSLMKKKFVDELHWIEEQEMLDLIAIAQSSPGAIAVNGAIVVGYKLAGIVGVFISILATILPPFVFLSVISFFYTVFSQNMIIQLLLKGMQAGVGAVICSVVLDMGKGIIHSRNISSILIMVISFCITYFLNINVIFVVIACILIGVLRVLYSFKGGKKI